jgi:hypothetical protein
MLLNTMSAPGAVGQRQRALLLRRSLSMAARRRRRRHRQPPRRPLPLPRPMSPGPPKSIAEARSLPLPAGPAGSDACAAGIAAGADETLEAARIHSSPPPLARLQASCSLSSCGARRRAYCGKRSRRIRTSRGSGGMATPFQSSHRCGQHAPLASTDGDHDARSEGS